MTYKALLFPRNLTALVEHYAQYKALDEDPRFEPVMVSYSRDVAARIESFGDIRHFPLPNSEPQDRMPIPMIANLWRLLRGIVPFASHLERICSTDRIAHSLPISILRYTGARRSLREALRILEDCFAELQPDIVMLPGDRELGLVPAITRASELNAVITVVSLTTAIARDGSSEIDGRSARHRFRTRPWLLPLLWNMVLAWRHPEILSPDGRKVLFSPGWLISALLHERMLSFNPWYQGGGQSNFVITEGPEKTAAFIRGGVSKEKILEIGSLLHDDLYEAFQETQDRRSQLSQASSGDVEEGSRTESFSPVVVFAVPSYAEQSLIDWDTHLETLHEIGSVLSRFGIQPVLSLHPKSEPRKYAFLVEEYGCQLMADATVGELIAKADLFICGNSSTIEMAAICVVPVINLDYPRLQFRHWDTYGGVQTVTDMGEFSDCIARYMASSEERSRMRAAQQKMSARLAIFDGQSTRRFCDCLTDLIDKNRAGSCVSSA